MLPYVLGWMCFSGCECISVGFKYMIIGGYGNDFKFDGDEDVTSLHNLLLKPINT